MIERIFYFSTLLLLIIALLLLPLNNNTNSLGRPNTKRTLNIRKQKRVHHLKPYKTPRVLLSFLGERKKKDFQSFLNFFLSFLMMSQTIHPKLIRI